MTTDLKNALYLSGLILILLISSCVSIQQYTTNSDSHPTIGFLKNQLKEISDAPVNPDNFVTDTSNGNNTIHLSEPWWLIPSVVLPDDVKPQPSNNNVSIAIFNHRLYVAFRTSKTHFASKHTGMYIISTHDGRNWTKELEMFSGKDAREPFLININDTLRFYYFTAGTKMLKFEPGGIWLYNQPIGGTWQGPVQISNHAEVHWSMKNRRGQTYLTTYSGSHYQLKGDATVRLNFYTTQNGMEWNPVDDSGVVYLGGVSEADFEFDRTGNLWAIGRLEDGDKTGFGSHVFYADSGHLNVWKHKPLADPRGFMSPKMFRQGDDFFVIARRQLGKKEFGHATRKKSMKNQRLQNWISYSLSPKTSALYKLNKQTQNLEWLMDLPGAGDTAFPSIVQLNARLFLIANYSSPPHKKRFTWLRGQLGKTMIYLQVISFGSN